MYSNTVSNVLAISSQNNFIKVQDPHQFRTTLYPQVRHNKTLNVYELSKSAVLYICRPQQIQRPSHLWILARPFQTDENPCVIEFFSKSRKDPITRNRKKSENSI